MLNDVSNNDVEYKPVGGQGSTSSGQSGLGITPPQLPSEVTQAGVVMDIYRVVIDFQNGPVHESEEHKTENEDAKD